MNYNMNPPFTPTAARYLWSISCIWTDRAWSPSSNLEPHIISVVVGAVKDAFYHKYQQTLNSIPEQEIPSCWWFQCSSWLRSNRLDHDRQHDDELGQNFATATRFIIGNVSQKISWYCSIQSWFSTSETFRNQITSDLFDLKVQNTNTISL